MKPQGDFAIEVRHFELAEPLRPFFTALYHVSFQCDPGVVVEDWLHPEWTALRFLTGGALPVACVGPGEMEPTWPFIACGPTSRALRFRTGAARLWGLGLLPAGYARYVRVPAAEMADRIVDGLEHEGFRHFAPLLDIVRDTSLDAEEVAARIERFLLSVDNGASRHQERVLACQAALCEPDFSSVSELCERLGVNRRSLERLCSRYFGFSPKMLLRRQRFLRSLAHFMLAEKGSWSRALDGQYFDQAHFVRDFKAFMHMTPSEYASAPHPIIDPSLARRMADQGVLPPTDMPTTLRYRETGASDRK